MGALDILLISFGAGVASSDCTIDCNVSGTAGAILLAMPPLLAMLILRDRLGALLTASRGTIGRLRAVQGPPPISFRTAA